MIASQPWRIAASIERLWTFSGSDTVTLLIQRSGKAIKEQKKELAQKLLDAAVDLAPDFTEAFSQRAYFHFTQNNYDAAVGDLRRVLALDPSHYKALEGLAQIWRQTGNKRGALKVMQQLLEVHPFASGAKQIYEDLKKEVDGQGI
jgi:tetratricopeptide (TPR) repeat protein